MTTVHWTLPERAWGPTGEHVATVGDLKATVRNVRRAGEWEWHVRHWRDGVVASGTAPNWQAARRDAAQVLTESVPA